jgi:uncharacterized protein with HEPN domain
MSPDFRERDLVKCEDMRLYAERARLFLGARTLDQFCQDEMVQAAVVRCIEVIGEAARLVSMETRRHSPQVPWALIVGMRHVLAHDYGAVDLPTIFSVVVDQIPDLIRELAALISLLESETGWRDDADPTR